MARKREVMRWCDRCGVATEGLQRVMLRRLDGEERDGQMTVDFCESCGEVPLSEWVAMIPHSKDGPRRRGRLVVDEEVVNRTAKRRRKVS